MAVLCYALSAASRRRQRTQQREPRAGDAGVAADIDGGSSDTLNADHDARLHKGATGGEYIMITISRSGMTKPRMVEMTSRDGNGT